MSTLYFITYIITYFKIFKAVKSTQVRVDGVSQIQSMDHINNIEKTLSGINKNRKIMIINFIPLMSIPEMKNPE